MLWYVIQTYTGREEKLVDMVLRMVPRKLYGDCFVAYHEQLRRRHQENQIYVERMFPGYIFITSREPEELFCCLKKIPAMAKLMSDGDFFFLPLETDEMAFLERIMDKEHVIRLSYIATDGNDHVTYMSRPLEICGSCVMKYQFRKRYAVIRTTLAGEEKTVRMGIILDEDIRRELSAGNVKAASGIWKTYREAKETEDESLNSGEAEQRADESLNPGDRVVVVSGVFEGMQAVVCQVKKYHVRVGIHFFERDMIVEVPGGSVKKARI